MLNSILSDKLPAVTQILRENGATRAYAFGSVCTERFNEASDVDLLIAFDESLDLVQYGENYFAIADALEAVLQRPVDLVTEQSLHNPHFVAAVEHTKTPINE